MTRRFGNLLLFFLIAACSLAFVYFEQPVNRQSRNDLATRIHPANVRNVSGIAFDGKSLWITEENSQSILQINPQTGAVEGKIDFPVKATGGSAWDGESLWQLAWEEKKIYQINVNSGKILGSFASPGQGICSGLTFDGKYLWLANYEDENIYQIDQTRDGKILQTQPGNFETTGLAWDGEYLWSGLLIGTKTHDEETPYTGFIQQKVPGTREVRAVIPITGVGTGGSDWTPDRPQATRLWWFDMYHQQLIEVDLTPKNTPLYRYGLGCVLALAIFICYLAVGRLLRV